MNIRYRVDLTAEERNELGRLLSGGRCAARRLKRAQILLAADDCDSDQEIERTIRRQRLDDLPHQAPARGMRFGGGSERRATPGPRARTTGKQEALLVATACANPPAGRARWTLELLAGEMIKLTDHDELSRETVRRRLLIMTSSRGARTCGAFPRSTPNTSPAWRMCSISTTTSRTQSARSSASTKARPRSSARPACPFPPGRDSWSVSTANIGATARPISLSSSTPTDPGAGSRSQTGGRRRTSQAACAISSTSTSQTPRKSAVVLDNLSTHSAGALYQTFPAPEARRILRRIEFHYTPRHASWLNMVEIEIGVLRNQCLDRRIDSRGLLVSEIAAWEQQRNSSGASINWMFTPEKARAKNGPRLSDPNQ